MISKYPHIGMLNKGRDFLNCANKLNEDPHWLIAPLPVYYLYLHSIELSLKSFILLKTNDITKCIKISHDLELAWSEAEKLGINEAFPDNEKLIESIALINKIYKGKELEYYYPGVKEIPVIHDISSSSNALYETLAHLYRNTMKQNQARI